MSDKDIQEAAGSSLVTCHLPLVTQGVIPIEHQRIVIVDDEPSIIGFIELNLTAAGFEVLTASTGAEGLELATSSGCDLVVTDLKLPDMDGVELMRQIHMMAPSMPIIIVTAYGTIENAVNAIKQGAYDYVTKPIEIEDLLIRIEKAFALQELHSEVRHLKDALKSSHCFDCIIRASTLMDRLCRQAAQLATSDVTILIQGESGTGKELLAQAIHYSSPRAEHPLVPIDCATLSETLLENDLFGHTKGAYTGAHISQSGLLAAAHRGTIFLDEIGDMPLMTQAKLLRVLQEKSFRPVGSPKSISIDVRIIVATNKNLKDTVLQGAFREDLFYRISAATLTVPPLRDRSEDIPLLARHFLSACTGEGDHPLTGFSHAAMNRLLAYHWPGNVRELMNKIKYAAAIAEGPLIDVGDLFAELEISHESLKPLRRAKEEAMQAFERQYLLSILHASGGNILEAAKAAGINRTNLYALLRRHGIDPTTFKPPVRSLVS